MSIKRHSQMSIKQWIAMPLAIGIGVFAVNSSEGETVLEGVYRKEFIASAIEACVREAMADPKNKTIAKPIISEYCNCYANGMVDRMRHNDVVKLAKAYSDKRTPPSGAPPEKEDHTGRNGKVVALYRRRL